MTRTFERDDLPMGATAVGHQDAPSHDSEFGAELGSTASLSELIAQARQGDDHAVKCIYDSYVRRLLGLVRRWLPDNFRTRFDSQDVVQAAMASFFGGLKDGQYEFENNGQLWHLLAAIAMNKLREQKRFHQAQSRDVGRERSLADPTASIHGIPIEELIGEPSHEEVTEIHEVVKLVLEEYTPKQRHIVALCLQGYSVKEIAAKAVTSETNARQILKDFKEDLAARLNSSFVA